MKIRLALIPIAAGALVLAACDGSNSNTSGGNGSNTGASGNTPSGSHGTSTTNSNGTNRTSGTGTTPSTTRPSTTPAPSTTPPTGTTNPNTPPGDTDKNRDNTGVNKRDADGGTKTPMDQPNNKADIDTAAAIRRAVTDDKTLSTNAHNCKIIVENGVVTLRGPVNSQAEKDTIERAAKAAPGVKSVVNELEIKAP